MGATIWLGLWVCLQATVSVAQQLVIKGQRELRTEQGKSITIGLGDLTVEADESLGYPNGFYLEIDDKGHHDVNGSTITPAAGFSGTLKVKIRVTNGKVKSDKFQLRIDVVKTDGGGDGGGDEHNGEDDDDGEDDDGDDDGDDDDDDGDNDNGSGNQGNQKPAIVSQVAVEISKNQNFTIRLSHLVVTDADNDYPDDFSLKVESGSNYAVSGTTITPVQNFVGTLAINLRVNDGKTDSDVFHFQIVVKDLAVAPPNAKPVITAHAPLSTFRNEPVTLKLTHLSVTDPDDQYPADFTLTLLTGTNCTVSGHTMTPSPGFTGTATVKVKVHDGKDDSNVFEVRVNVLERGTLQILSQNAIIIPEDSAYTLRLSDLNVSDPSDSYPAGFSLSIADGDNYTVEGNTIRPGRNFYGNLIVPVKVAKQAASSNVFAALVKVGSVNDAPAFATFDTAPIVITPVTETAIAKEVKTSDVDHAGLAFAEAELDSASTLTQLGYLSTPNVRGIFDQKNGVLVFLGYASLEEYDRALQSITFTSADSTRKKRTIRFRLNDGETYSNWYEKTLIMSDTELTLDIPTAFTPNNDNANDTWAITLLQDHSQAQLDLKVYNRHGVLLFESDSFERQWDGRFNGELLPADSYFFTLEVTREDRKTRRKGIVAILR